MSLTESLIESVKARPILYDIKHPDYKNIRKKDKIWKDIEQELNQDAEELKKKWKNIKDCYLKHLRTVNAKDDQVIKRSYKNWHWASQMEFCRPQAEATISDIENSCSVIQSEIVHSQNVAANEDSRGFEEKPVYDNRKRKRNEKDVSTPLLDHLQSRHHHADLTDATDLIFLGYSQIIKKFSPMRQAIAKMRIAQIIMEEELNNLDETSTSSTKNCSPVSHEPTLQGSQALSPTSSITFSLKKEEIDLT